MKIAFISGYGDACDIAFRMSLDGHSVKTYIKDPKYSENWDGIIKKAPDWRPLVQWADFFFFEDNSCSEIWEQVHTKVPCFGGSTFGMKLEKDRHFAHSIMKRSGLKMNECLSFKSLRDAIPHLKEHKERHVIKPQGKMVESHHLIIGESEDNSDAISGIDHLIEQGLQVDSVEVEQFRGGVEAGLSIWCNGVDERVGPVNLNFEHKRSNDKEIGYLTPEMGTLMRYLEDGDNPFYQETLKKIVPILRAADYRGQIDLGFKVTRDGFFPTEFTSRIGKPAWSIEDILHITPWADLAFACATGKKIDLQVRYDWGICVVLAAFGFPFEDKAIKISKGLVVEGIDENNMENIHPWQMKLNKKGKFVVGHGAGLVLAATGRGESIDQAKRRSYYELSKIKLQNSFHRWDIGDKINTWELDELGILPREESVV